MSQQKSQLLVVEDDDLLRRSVTKALSRHYDVDTAASCAEGLAKAESRRYDLVLLDISLPDRTGLDLLADLNSDEARAGNPDRAVVMMTAREEVATVVEAMRRGASDYLVKPVEFDILLETVARILAAHQDREPTAPSSGSEPPLPERYRLVGESEQMAELRKEIDEVSRSDSHVLIWGETGTGKELVARGIHFASGRAHGNFVAVNCGAIPRELLEAELFGHAKGAFTGASSKGVGKFELAGSGTLLLDEVGELPLEAQVRLLRVLEEREFYAVGSSRLIEVGCRVLAATHRDLRLLVEHGEFREDLYYRLNVFVIRVPPLRERPDDVAPLAMTFLDEFTRRYEKSFRSIGPELVTTLEAAPWPGNVRELRNTIERAVLRHDGECLTIDQVEIAERRSAAARDDLSASSLEGFDVPTGGLDFAEVERELLENALRKAGGNKSSAARLLNLSLAKFSYRLKKYGLG